MARLAVSKEQARRFLIAKQDYRSYGSPFSGKDGVGKAINHLGAVQIDPINVFSRNHDHVLYSRVADYSPTMLDTLLYQEKTLFEYYCNALSILPMAEYPYFAHQMRGVQEAYQSSPEITEASHRIMARLHNGGAVMAKEIQSGHRAAAWWDGGVAKSRVEKVALDVLHYTGKVMIHGREGVTRRYDLPERIVPPSLLRERVEPAEFQEYMMRKFLLSYGLSQTSLFRFGWGNMPKGEAKAVLRRLVEREQAVEVSIEGVKRSYYCHHDDVAKLLSPEPLPETVEAIFVAPLDNLLWDRERLLDIFSLFYRWEVYTPAAKRIYGYYVLPVLFGENFVGRIELKAWRERGELQVVRMWLDDTGSSVKEAIWRTASGLSKYLGLRLCGL